jgi:hypothetical protein
MVKMDGVQKAELRELRLNTGRGSHEPSSLDAVKDMFNVMLDNDGGRDSGAVGFVLIA